MFRISCSISSGRYFCSCGQQILVSLVTSGPSIHKLWIVSVGYNLERFNSSTEMSTTEQIDRLIRFSRTKSGKFGFQLITSPRDGHLIVFQGELLKLILVNGIRVRKCSHDAIQAMVRSAVDDIFLACSEKVGLDEDEIEVQVDWYVSNAVWNFIVLQMLFNNKWILFIEYFLVLRKLRVQKSRVGMETWPEEYFFISLIESVFVFRSRRSIFAK